MKPIFVISCFLTLVFFLNGCATNSTIANNLSERDSNEIIVLLQNKGIDAQKVAAPRPPGAATTTEQLWDIAVPASQLTHAIAVLNQAGLPRVKGTSLLDLFGTQGLVPSDLQDKIRYQEGLSEQLATTIRKMDGVIDANVQISFSQEEEDEKKTPLTASVYVKHRGMLDNPNSILVTKIKRLVASSVPGLTIDNVSVITDRALFADLSMPGIGSETEPLSFVSIWSIVLARESALRFRILFYLFIFFLFISIASLVWLIWKFYPLIEYRGGIKALYNPEPFKPEDFREIAVVEVQGEE